MFKLIGQLPCNPSTRGFDEISTHLSFIDTLFHIFFILSFVLKSQLNGHWPQFCLRYFRLKYTLYMLKQLLDECVHWGRHEAIRKMLTMTCRNKNFSFSMSISAMGVPKVANGLQYT